MKPANRTAVATRLVALGLIIGLAGWWAGTRWGTPQPDRVGAVPDLALPTGPGELAPEEQLTVRLYQQAAPAVANIVTRTMQYDFFFNPVAVEGAGSGFLIDEQGHILTNYHVVEGAQSIEVTLGDPRITDRFEARLLGQDERNDVALLKIDPGAHRLTPLPLGNSSELQVGQHVLAIGNPFGFQTTLTTGVLSAVGRTVQTGPQTFVDEAIQTDAAINRGNSGGPLLNTRGEVIGINTVIVSPTGAAAGIGFAIPVNTARRIAQDLLTEGRVRRAYLGVEGAPVWPALARALELPIEEGILVERVMANSPAARAGIRGGDRAVRVGLSRLIIGGDVVVAIDAQPARSLLDLNVLLNRKRPGDEVTVTVYRGRQRTDIRVTLGER
jgi:S1-C subfamily serine protease